MYVIVNMVDTETVVTVAARAVAEFKTGSVNISPAAHCTFVPILVFIVFALCISCSLFKANSLRRSTRCKWTHVCQEILPADDYEVEHRNKRKEGCCELPGKYVTKYRVYKITCADESQPFHLYRNDKEQQDTVIREKHRKRKEHGQIEEVRREPYKNAGDIIHQKSVDNVEKNSKYVINIELWRSPLAFQGIPDKIIEIKHQCYQNKVYVNLALKGGGDEHPCEQTPNLTLNNKGRVEIHEPDKHSGPVHHVYNKYANRNKDDVTHQSRNAKFAVFRTESVNGFVQCFQTCTPKYVVNGKKGRCSPFIIRYVL